VSDTDRPAEPKSEPADHPGVILPPPVVYASGLIAGVLIDMVLPLPLVSAPARWIVAAVFIAAGLVLAGGATTLFRRAGTHVQPHKPSTTVVTGGVYRYSRNPIYVGLTALYLGLAFVANTWWAAILLVPVLAVIHWGVIAREERYLEGKFGETYRAYSARVRRWI
jgi:protein-S-isoprenylcysteine O-methyltransferase Ste14